MKTITQVFSADHLQCNQLFAEIEEKAYKNDWQAVSSEFAHFRDMMERHFNIEEQTLFPAIEERTGQTSGPTAVMKMEHQQMRQVFDNMHKAVEQQDNEEYLGLSETLLILMQQHNAKEEQILYPMGDQILGTDVADIIAKQQAG
ncbi:MAG: hemerythrin domain-containing protein [Thiomargarita sp.]|nr:hemerythrin domain-containing protein [Thiomargarita sp.]